MRWYLYALVAACCLTTSSLTCAADRVFEGPWKTTNRKLDGLMTCIVKDLGNEKWQGRFYGVWQGVPFDYTVRFSGPAHSLQGTAVIDHADYTWTGSITEGDEEPAVMKATFGGSRYTGSFQMKELKRTQTAAKPPVTTQR